MKLSEEQRHWFEGLSIEITDILGKNHLAVYESFMVLEMAKATVILDIVVNLKEHPNES